MIITISAILVETWAQDNGDGYSDSNSTQDWYGGFVEKEVGLFTMTRNSIGKKGRYYNSDASQFNSIHYSLNPVDQIPSRATIAWLSESQSQSINGLDNQSPSSSESEPPLDPHLPFLNLAILSVVALLQFWFTTKVNRRIARNLTFANILKNLEMLEQLERMQSQEEEEFREFEEEVVDREYYDVVESEIYESIKEGVRREKLQNNSLAMQRSMNQTQSQQNLTLNNTNYSQSAAAIDRYQSGTQNVKSMKSLKSLNTNLTNLTSQAYSQQLNQSLQGQNNSSLASSPTSFASHKDSFGLWPNQDLEQAQQLGLITGTVVGRSMMMNQNQNPENSEVFKIGDRAKKGGLQKAVAGPTGTVIGDNLNEQKQGPINESSFNKLDSLNAQQDSVKSSISKKAMKRKKTAEKKATIAENYLSYNMINESYQQYDKFYAYNNDSANNFNESLNQNDLDNFASFNNGGTDVLGDTTVKPIDKINSTIRVGNQTDLVDGVLDNLNVDSTPIPSSIYQNGVLHQKSNKTVTSAVSARSGGTQVTSQAAFTNKTRSVESKSSRKIPKRLQSNISSKTTKSNLRINTDHHGPNSNLIPSIITPDVSPSDGPGGVTSFPVQQQTQATVVHKTSTQSTRTPRTGRNLESNTGGTNSKGIGSSPLSGTHAGPGTNSAQLLGLTPNSMIVQQSPTQVSQQAQQVQQQQQTQQQQQLNSNFITMENEYLGLYSKALGQSGGINTVKSRLNLATMTMQPVSYQYQPSLSRNLGNFVAGFGKRVNNLSNQQQTQNFNLGTTSNTVTAQNTLVNPQQTQNQNYNNNISKMVTTTTTQGYNNNNAVTNLNTVQSSIPLSSYPINTVTVSSIPVSSIPVASIPVTSSIPATSSIETAPQQLHNNTTNGQQQSQQNLNQQIQQTLTVSSPVMPNVNAKAISRHKSAMGSRLNDTSNSNYMNASNNLNLNNNNNSNLKVEISKGTWLSSLNSEDANILSAKNSNQNFLNIQQSSSASAATASADQKNIIKQETIVPSASDSQENHNDLKEKNNVVKHTQQHNPVLHSLGKDLNLINSSLNQDNNNLLSLRDFENSNINNNSYSQTSKDIINQGIDINLPNQINIQSNNDYIQNQSRPLVGAMSSMESQSEMLAHQAFLSVKDFNSPSDNEENNGSKEQFCDCIDNLNDYNDVTVNYEDEDNNQLFDPNDQYQDFAEFETTALLQGQQQDDSSDRSNNNENQNFNFQNANGQIGFDVTERISVWKILTNYYYTEGQRRLRAVNEAEDDDEDVIENVNDSSSSDNSDSNDSSNDDNIIRSSEKLNTMSSSIDQSSSNSDDLDLKRKRSQQEKDDDALANLILLEKRLFRRLVTEHFESHLLFLLVSIALTSQHLAWMVSPERGMIWNPWG